MAPGHNTIKRCIIIDSISIFGHFPTFMLIILKGHKCGRPDCLIQIRQGVIFSRNLVLWFENPLGNKNSFFSFECFFTKDERVKKELERINRGQGERTIDGNRYSKVKLSVASLTIREVYVPNVSSTYSKSRFTL